MEKVYSFTICESIQQNVQNGKGQSNVLVAPILAIRPQYIPGAYSFGISIGISGINLMHENKVSFAIFSPANDTIIKSEENVLPIAETEDTMPAEHQGFVFAIDFRNVEFNTEGVYSFAFYLNGKEIERHQIPVFKRKD